MYRGAIAWLFLVCVASAQLVEDDELFYQLLPRVEDPGTQALFDDRELFFYTPAEIPPAFQSGARVHAVNTPAISNGNVHLPWSHTAGLHLCTDFATFKGIHLPRREDGSLYPIVVFK